MSKHAAILGLDIEVDTPEKPPIYTVTDDAVLTVGRRLLLLCRQRGIPLDSGLRVSGGDKCYDATYTHRVELRGPHSMGIQLCRDAAYPGAGGNRLTVSSLIGSIPLDGLLLGPNLRPMRYSKHTHFGGVRLVEVG